QDLAVLTRGLDLDPGDRAPDSAEPVVLERGHRPDPGRLGHTPALEHGHSSRVEELENLRRNRGRAADGLAHPPTEQVPDLLEDLLAVTAEVHDRRSLVV